MKPATALFTMLLIPGLGFCQTMVGSAYSAPLLTVAPGQVVPVLVTGLKTVLTSGVQRAENIPLPLALGGISVTFTQGLQYSRTLPLVAIYQFNQCASANPPTSDCLLTAIIVQIPFDIAVPNPLLESPVAQPISSLEIYENGAMSKAFIVVPVPDQIHVLQSCDIGGQTLGTGVCFPIVTHGDGNFVLEAPRVPGQPALSNSEAKPGEALVMYAYGLGPVSPVVQAGAVSPKPPAVVVSPLQLQFDYRLNAGPSAPTLNSSFTSTAHPTFAGLTPGQVGLYQISFVVPPPPPGTRNCGSPVESNLTISVTAADGQSYSGAAICVDTGWE